MRILVIVPCYNEEASAHQVVKEVQLACPEADIIVIDDGSLDRTREVASAAGAKVATLPYNLGIGASMQTGYRCRI
jgi:glycosyltransferase involved in cell wall biosynthesis